MRRGESDAACRRTSKMAKVRLIRGPVFSDKTKHFNNQFEVILREVRAAAARIYRCSPLAASKVSGKKILRRFRRNRAGSAAVEFALVAPVFFALLFAIIEVATYFFASQVLETITQDSARVLMTGQAQTSQVCTDPVSGAPRPATKRHSMPMPAARFPRYSAAPTSTSTSRAILPFQCDHQQRDRRKR